MTNSGYFSQSMGNFRPLLKCNGRSKRKLIDHLIVGDVKRSRFTDGGMAIGIFFTQVKDIGSTLSDSVWKITKYQNIII
ncbi:hypothetical protein CS542_08540 [Pedobacter sp. IW39]|nr:hypothetical protein CS542_08540 [Pedobacter sp. IW39]